MCGQVKLLIGDCWLHDCRSETLFSRPESLCPRGNKHSCRPCPRVIDAFPRLVMGFEAVWVGRLCPKCKDRAANARADALINSPQGAFLAQNPGRVVLPHGPVTASGVLPALPPPPPPPPPSFPASSLLPALPAQQEQQQTAPPASVLPPAAPAPQQTISSDSALETALSAALEGLSLAPSVAEIGAQLGVFKFS